jgi:hypothetical protein
MPFEQWINCRLGFDISIPQICVGTRRRSLSKRVNNAAIPDNGADVQRPMRRGRWSEIPAAAGLALAASKTSGSKDLQGFPLWQFQVALLPLAYPASIIKKLRRTIERRLIRTLHLVERSIPKFRIGCLSLTRDGERPTSSRCDLAISGEAVVDRARSAMVSAGACGRDERPRRQTL